MQYKRFLELQTGGPGLNTITGKLMSSVLSTWSVILSVDVRRILSMRAVGMLSFLDIGFRQGDINVIFIVDQTQMTNGMSFVLTTGY